MSYIVHPLTYFLLHSPFPRNSHHGTRVGSVVGTCVVSSVVGSSVGSRVGSSVGWSFVGSSVVGTNGGEAVGSFVSSYTPSYPSRGGLAVGSCVSADWKAMSRSMAAEKSLFSPQSDDVASMSIQNRVYATVMAMPKAWSRPLMSCTLSSFRVAAVTTAPPDALLDRREFMRFNVVRRSLSRRGLTSAFGSAAADSTSGTASANTSSFVDNFTLDVTPLFVSPWSWLSR